PFCRVDPFDGKKAQEEVKRCVQVGARGLKLHPLSQGFIGKIRSSEVIDLLELSAFLNIPVIFDVANSGVGEDIGIAVEETKSRLGPGSNLKVILGHFGFAYSSEIMHELIQRPELYSELSGCRGEDVRLFFHKLIDHNGLAGIDKVSYASDYNYFGVPQCADFISYVLSNDFRELVGEEYHLEYARKVLGLNALSLFPVWSNSSPPGKRFSGVWTVSTSELADQIIGALKDRRVSIRPILVSIDGKGDITAWNIQKSPDFAFVCLIRSQQDLSWITITNQISKPKKLEKSLQTLRSIESNDALDKFDLQNLIAP
ncbi:MAG: amidohydrolase family protein, partial [Candidatus Hodarchaeales archaeon]